VDYSTVGATLQVSTKNSITSLTNIAEILEDKEFELEKFKSQLSEDQYSWLISHKKEIKKHLKGIIING
jgi:hypothetical protein